jgi:hypothetical protein
MALKTQFNEGCDKYWTVTTNKKVGYYGQTRSAGVIAKSAEEVSQKMLTRYPDEVIVSINHRGPVDVI